MKVGIVCGSFKPLHRGHFNLITKAAKECNVVKVFASLADRENVSGQRMRHVWESCVKNSLPENVDLMFCQNPIRGVYDFLGKMDKTSSSDSFYVYSDMTDINKNFSSLSLKKYMPQLYEGMQLVMVPFERVGEFNVSGTQLRAYLRDNKQEQFISYLPECVDGVAIWNILKGNRT